VKNLKEKGKISLLGLFAIISVFTILTTAYASPGGRPASPIVIYVTSQGLSYQSIPGPSLPWKEQRSHTFQKLEGIAPDGLWTEFGPGNVGYKGGRWWIDHPDLGIQGEQDEYDTYFLCPLLGPGKELV
jgi:hypothetical protein